jgi:hypothetical protein
VIDLENVWKWLGFSRKDPANVVLEKHFVKNVDFIVALQKLLERKNEHLILLYYILYDECPDILKEKYPKPVLYKDGVGKYDANHNLIKEYTSKYDCVKNDYDIGEKTLKKALETGAIYNGFYYRLLGPKLNC